MKGILFLCVANSARSQMAEAIARSLMPSGTKVWSAGSRPTSLRPEAVTVLREIGLDATGQRAKAASEIPVAEEECPIFLGPAVQLHWDLPDPSAVEATETERLAAFRRVRDELRRRITELLAG